MSPLKRAGVALGSLLLATSVALPANSVTTLRAVGPGISPEAIVYVATNAEPREIDPTAFATPEALTPRIVINRLCGEVSDTYYREFLRANSSNPAPDDVIGLEAGDLIWPACFYVNVLDGTEVTVLPGETSYKIYERLTGGKPTEAQLRAFFSKSGLTWSELSNLKAGQTLVVHHYTEAVTFKPKPPLTSETFTAGLALATKAQGPLSVSARITEPERGKILVGNLPPAAGAPANPGSVCRKSGQPPFDAKAVFEAYRFASEYKSPQVSPASVAVVDNGFFGAQLTPSGAEFQNSPFKSAFFRKDTEAVIARKLKIGMLLWPINYAFEDLKTSPEVEKGHGTHVTGLILGGPTFRPHWDSMLEGGKPWVEITQLNVGRGSRFLVPGSEGSLASALGNNKPWIVNLSVGFNGGKDQQMVQVFEDLFAQNPNSLFVVSAGNDRNDVRPISAYPAALGGPFSPNVISVAALDGDDGLAPFSNYSRQAVDIAAPGCGVASWLNDGMLETALNGTSQSAPLITFEASLLRSLNPEATPRDLKTRIIVSGDLLTTRTTGAPPDRWRDTAPEMVAFRVKANIPISIYWSLDYLKVSGRSPGEYLGEVMDLTPLGCVGDIDTEADDLWAFKRDGASGWLYNGRRQARLFTPCAMDANRMPTFNFLATHQIIDGKPAPLAGVTDLRPAFDDVVHLVRKMKFAE